MCLTLTMILLLLLLMLSHTASDPFHSGPRSYRVLVPDSWIYQLAIPGLFSVMK